MNKQLNQYEIFIKPFIAQDNLGTYVCQVFFQQMTAYGSSN